MRLPSSAAVFVLFLSLAPAAQGQSTCRNESRWEGLNVLADQDVFWAPAFDQDYTMGLEFVFQGGFVRDWRLSAPLEGLDHVFGLGRAHESLWTEVNRDEPSYTAHSASFGNVAFTPTKAQLGETEPIHDDRPYANLFYVKVRRASARGSRALVTDLTLGVLGLRIGEWVQKKIHTWNGDVLPGGWPNQISDGGEPTLKYRVSPRWRLVERFPKDESRAPWGFDLAASLEANAGYYTNVAWGMTARAGLVRSPWWGLERNAIADVRGGRRSRERKRGTGGGEPFVREAYVWATGGTTAWLYNGLLQGQFRESAVTLSPDPASPAPMRLLTGDAQVGGTLRLRWLGLGLTYGVEWLTPTFGGPKNRVHSWGSIYLSFQ
jgi:hypothetical protein